MNKSGLTDQPAWRLRDSVSRDARHTGVAFVLAAELPTIEFRSLPGL